MNYVCKVKKPEEILRELGFEKAIDRGWHIILSPNRRKFDPYNKSTWIPHCRIHAIFFENQLNIHLDAPNGPMKHRTFQREFRVRDLMEKVKNLDQ